MGPIYQLQHGLLGPCEDAAQCVEVSDSMCKSHRFKTKWQLLCPTKCSTQECKEDDACKAQPLSKELCEKLLKEKCPQSCAKLNDNWSRTILKGIYKWYLNLGYLIVKFYEY